MGKQEGTMSQIAPWPTDLERAIEELELSGALTGWRVWMSEADRGQNCWGLTLYIVPNNSDSYHPDQPARTTFLYAVPAAAFNRESWEEWLWARIEETEGHERAEGFGFHESGGETRRPFKPAHPDGWNPGVVRSVVSESVVNTPNAGRLVQFPCKACGHNHKGKMGEHFTISEDRGCVEEDCACGKKVGARQPTELTGNAEIFIDGLRFIVAPGKYSGLDVSHFPHPPLEKNRDLFLDGSDTEVLINATDTVEVINGLRFFSEPKEWREQQTQG